MKAEPLPPSPGLLPGFVRFAGRIRADRRFARPELLWFDLPEACQPDARVSGDPWLLALLPLAFYRGEPLEITSPVDPQLLSNAADIQNIWHEWHPALSPVPIHAAPETDARPAGRGRTGLFFTGGVDSFFTLLHYDAAARSGALPEAQPVDDLIYVWGYDIPLAHQEAWKQKRRTLAAIARQLGKNFVPVVSNLRETCLRELHWGVVMHGPALGAPGLLLGQRLSRLLLSSGGKCKDLYPWGSHPRVDPLMSTHATRVIRYSGDSDRFEKTAFIAGSDVALQHLHVCWENGDARNCGRCEKCLRTLLTLELLGVREKAASFPQIEFSLEAVRRSRLGSAGAEQVMLELVPHALRLGRADVADAVEACLRNSRRLQATRARSPSRRFRQFIRNGLARFVPSSRRPAS